MCNSENIKPTLQDEILSAINRHSAENGSNTPDYVLAEYLVNCLSIFNIAVIAREDHYGRDMRPRPKFYPGKIALCGSQDCGGDCEKVV